VVLIIVNGIDFHCNNDGNLIDVPLDYSATANEYDNDVAVFNVNYSQQNQKYLKILLWTKMNLPKLMSHYK
jgi:hypothetical protein